MNEAKQPWPLGIKIISAIQFIISLQLIILGIIKLVKNTELSLANNLIFLIIPQELIKGIIYLLSINAGRILSIYPLVMAIIFFSVGFNLIKRKRFARYALITISLIALIISLIFGLYTSGIVQTIISSLFNLLILIYIIFSKKVKEIYH